MRDIYKNKTFWFIAAPAILALWPLLAGLIYLPRAEANFAEDRDDYLKAQKVIVEILDIDPERLDYATEAAGGDFDYASAVEKVATMHNIPATKYKMSSGMIIKSSDRKTQSAKIILDDLSIVQIARFMSTMQMRWVDLQCESVKLTKSKAGKDTWKSDMDFKYFLSE